MLSVFLVAGLAITLAAVYAFVRKRGRPLATEQLASTGIPAAPDATNQLVVVVGPCFEEVTQAAIDFRALYKDHDVVAYPFWAHALETGITAFTFPQHLPAELFYYLINYLSYPASGYAGTAQVRGWATLPVSTRDQVAPLPEPVMVCVPPNDTDYDTVLLLTPAPAVYQLSFQVIMCAVLLRRPVAVAYMAPPYALEAVRQLPAATLL